MRRSTRDPITTSNPANGGEPLEPRLVTLLKANPAAAAAEAMRTNIFLIPEETKIFREHLPFPTTGYFFPTTDFFLGVSGTPIRINTRWTATANGSIVGEDYFWQAAADGGGLASPQQGIDAISVSSANAGRITATLAGDTITVNAIPGFTGVAYFDYQVTYLPGEQGAGRVYVRFR
jgi:hypothetical protein